MIRVPGLRILLGLGFMLAGIWAPKPAQSAKSSDFYCAEMAMQPPAFFDFSVSECADGKEKVTRSVCTVTANCVFLTHEIKTAFKEEKEKSPLVEPEGGYTAVGDGSTNTGVPKRIPAKVSIERSKQKNACKLGSLRGFITHICH